MTGIIERLEAAVRLIEGCREFAALVPEVRVNFVYAPDNVVNVVQVAGVDGRITVVGGSPRAAGPVRTGVSDHMARLIIELRRYDRTIRAGLDFRWHETISDFVERYCREHALGFGCIDRTDEPKDLIGKDRGSMPWKVMRLVESSSGKVPPVFFESRGWGKEPLFFTVGADPVPLAERVIDIARGFAAHKHGR